MATTQGRPGRSRRHNPLGRWCEPPRDDASSRRHRGHRPSADPWLHLSGHSKVQERRADEPIREHRPNSSSSGVPPLPLSLLPLLLFLLWGPPPHLDAPPGHWDSYRLLLFDGLQLLVNTSVDRAAVRFVFPGTGLTPGRRYRAELRVEGGGLTAESSCEGATGENTAQITTGSELR
ncbi:hypothetical protein INR49_019405 [Caranx melampygus]|nr:hypothetical protein INR49_019405 [Caranx melampygus]